MTQEKVSGTLSEISNGRTTQSESQRGEALLTSRKDGAVGSKRHSQHLAIVLKQIWRTVEMNQADAPTWLAMEVALRGDSGDSPLDESTSPPRPALSNSAHGLQLQFSLGFTTWTLRQTAGQHVRRKTFTVCSHNILESRPEGSSN